MSSLEEGQQNQSPYQPQQQHHQGIISPAESFASDSPPKQNLPNVHPASGFFMPGGMLREIDKNGDGFVSRQEVEDFIGEHKIMNAERKLFKKAFIALLVTLLFFSTAIVLVVYGIILETKDTEMDGDVMVSKESGDAIQCANTDMIVVDGTIVSRSEQDANRRLQVLKNNFTLDDSTLSALGVRNIYKKRKLSSTMPDSYFQEILWFDIQSNTGSFLWFHISSILRIPSVNAKCGTYLKLGTTAGTIILDDDEIYYDDPMGNIFLSTGLMAFPQKDSSSRRRKLSKLGHSDMRRLATDEFSIVGFFNSIEEKEWTCESVKKPQLPEFYSANYTILFACNQEVEEGVEDIDQCLVTIPQSVDPIPGYGVVEVDGIKYAKHNSLAFVTSESSTFIDTYPHLPGMKVVTQVYPDKSARFFQVTEDGKLAQCSSAFDFTVEMKFPNEYIFYPLGEVDGGALYRYRLSYMGLTNGYNDEQEWIHIDYFEDSSTKLPKSLITDGRIVQVDSMEINEDIKPLSSYLSFTAEEFNTCLIATKVVNTERYEKYVENDLTFFNPDNITTTTYQYVKEWNAWDWNNTAYPPLSESLASFTYQSMLYYSVGHTTFDVTTEKYIGTDNFGEWIASILNIPPPEPYVSSNSSRRLEIDIDTDTPTVVVALKYFEVAYGFFFEEMAHYVSVGSEQCNGILCASGNIDAVIPNNAASQFNVGGTVTIDLDFKAFREEIVSIRYTYFGGLAPMMSNFGVPCEWNRVHVFKVHSTRNFAGQVKVTFGVLFAQAKEKTCPNGLTYTNPGTVQLFAKVQYFKGVAGLGNWKTEVNWKYDVSSWHKGTA